MSTEFPGFPGPSASTEAPLEMLAACHIRIERQCVTLRRLVGHVAQHGADDDARTAAASVMRYFDTAAPQHHADEEVDLFPALIESMAGSDAVCLHNITEGLADEHRELEVMWHRLRAALEMVVAGDAAALVAADVDQFTAKYEAHIKREDDELLPMASRLLTDYELDNIGRAMRERRGIASV